MNLLAARLREIRQDKEIAQKEIASFLNISPRAWQRYEQGTREPKIDDLIKLADYFNVTTDYLLGRTDKPN